MPLLTDDQKMLQETASSFLAEEGGPAKQIRHWRDTGCKDGFGHGLWEQMAELGFTGTPSWVTKTNAFEGAVGFNALKEALEPDGG